MWHWPKAAGGLEPRALIASRRPRGTMRFYVHSNRCAGGWCHSETGNGRGRIQFRYRDFPKGGATYPVRKNSGRSNGRYAGSCFVSQPEKGETLAILFARGVHE